MENLIYAVVYFVGLHLIVAGTPLRKVLVGVVGEKAYMGLFAVASLAGIIWVIRAYEPAALSPENMRYWAMPAIMKTVGAVVMFVAVFLSVGGILTPNPTAANQEGLLEKSDDLARGMVAITRHPFLWGVLFWAVFHFIINGTRAETLLFGGFSILTILGSVSIDRKRKAKMGEKWDAFAAQTSNLPFLAIIQGRAKFSLGEVGWWRIGVVVAVYIGLVLSHEWLFGVSPR